MYQMYVAFSINPSVRGTASWGLNHPQSPVSHDWSLEMRHHGMEHWVNSTSAFYLPLPLLWDPSPPCQELTRELTQVLGMSCLVEAELGFDNWNTVRSWETGWE
jgi:hypothetical protein